MALSAGDRLGSYEVLAAIGAGGMGEVYRARDPRLGREVAIKILPAAYASDADRLRRFEQEARAASALNHPNILTIYDVGTADGSPYLVSELLEGQTLRQRMAGTPLSSWRAVDYARQIAHGLAATHEKGILHRDLKPENVFITKDERVKILDFGLAKLGASRAGGEDFTQAQTVPGATEPGLVLGTVGYMSPEQVRGLTTDARSDIFSFGAIVYEMIAGRRAFSRESSVETMNAILAAEPPELSSAGGGVSPGIERIVRHCLEKSPEARFQSVRDLAFALGEVASGGASAVRSAGAEPVASRSRPAIQIAAVVTAVVALLLILVVANVGGIRTRVVGGTSPGHIGSIAVLPLENFSNDPEQEYFADGMTEALITDLAQIGALRVISVRPSWPTKPRRSRCRRSARNLASTR